MKNGKNERQGLFLEVSEMVWEGVMKLMRGVAGSSPDKESAIPDRFGLSSMREDVKALLGALEGNMVSFEKKKKQPSKDDRD